MIQLLCNGVYLDLYDNAGLQFTQDNPLFAFDNLKCERTTQFKLPSTPKNDNVFACARIPAYSGEGMRRKFSAQLQASALVKDGYLYISSFDGKDYIAVFVTGELVGLQAIRNAGKVKDILSDQNSTIVFNTTTYAPSATSSAQQWRNIRHKSYDGKTYPSWRFDGIINDAMAAIGATWVRPTMYLRGIVTEPKLLSLMSLSIQRAIDGNWVDVTQTYPYPRITTISTAAAVSSVLEKKNFDVEYRRHWEDYDIQTQQPVLRTITYAGNVQHFVAHQRLAITFASDFPSDMYIGTFENAGGYAGDFTFYGDRSFGKTWSGTQSVTIRSGSVLAGRTINIEAGQSFCLIKESDLLDYTQYTGNLTTHETWEQGWKNVRSAATFDKMTIQGTGEVADGFWLRLADSLPDMTLTELLKTAAALLGKTLYYTDADGVQFDALNFDSWSVKEIKTLTARKEVKRVFADYVQNNVIQYESGEGVFGAEKIQQAYTIDNDNLDEEKVLLEMPFSEGGSDGVYVYTREGVGAIVMADADPSKTTTYMLRVPIPQNANLQSLCNASTQYAIEARMSLMEYNAITPKTILLVDGIKYVWTARSWQNDIAKFTLAKCQ